MTTRVDIIIAIMGLLTSPALACDTETIPLGEACENTIQCDHAPDNEATVCHEGRCIRVSDITPDMEASMLEQSGVESAPAALDPASAGPPVDGAVRVARASGSGQVFAACRADERLTGGGCASDSRGQFANPVNGYPGEYSDHDTLGGRWYCTGSGLLRAYALCMRVVEAEQPAPPAAAVEPSADPSDDIGRVEDRLKPFD